MKTDCSVQKASGVHLRPRLQAAAALVKDAHTIADIGCDHGRLSCVLLQSGAASYAIATDISMASLQKAAGLCALTGLQERMETRLGDGLHILSYGEADTLFLCGMGGMLIAEILHAAPQPLMGARRVIMQPMRGVGQLRQYLYTHGYCVEEERIAYDSGRYYQIFSACPGRETSFPAGWPEDFFQLGHKAMNEPLFIPLAMHLLAQQEKRLKSAKGSAGAAILQKNTENLRHVILLCK